jgi:hypothetical protein
VDLAGKAGLHSNRAVEAEDLEVLREGDPSASNYELKAITDANGLHDEGLTGLDRWDGHEDDEPRSLAIRDPARTEWTASSGGVESVRTPAVERGRPDAAFDSGFIEPWYSQILVGWAMMLLVWAGLIAARSLYRLIIVEYTLARAYDVVLAVVAVLLLVMGAAGLLLLVDVGRQIRGARLPARRLGDDLSRQAAYSVYLRFRRFWLGSLRAIHSARL